MEGGRLRQSAWEESLLNSYLFVLLFGIISIVLVSLLTVLPRLLAPRSGGKKKLATYECGMEPYGDAWIQFSVKYYLVALLFVAFDVEVFFLVPWAVVYRELQGVVYWLEVVLFFAILMLALAYAWAKGIFKW